jgi:hypothetical protein
MGLQQNSVIESTEDLQLKGGRLLADPHVTIDEHGLRIADFTAEEYNREWEADLRAQGVALVRVGGDLNHQKTVLTEQDGYFLAPSHIVWRMATESLEEYLGHLSSKQRSRVKARLQKSAGTDLVLEPVTAENFEKWYLIYEREVVGKEHGRRTLAASWITDAVKRNEFSLLQYHSRDGDSLLGGAVLRRMPGLSQFNIAYAAYDHAAVGKELSFRTFVEALTLAKHEGFQTLSYGKDRNLYGHYYTIGLMEYKSMLGFSPQLSGDVKIIKVLNPDALGRDFLIFSGENTAALTTRHFTDRPRPINAPTKLAFDQNTLTQ